MVVSSGYTCICFITDRLNLAFVSRDAHEMVPVAIDNAFHFNTNGDTLIVRSPSVFILKMSTYLAGFPPSPIKHCHQLLYVALYM